jgi:hypothetical protein
LNVDHIERLETNIIKTICKLEMIFPSFFYSMEHLPIYLPFKTKVGGSVQYRWMLSATTGILSMNIDAGQ